MQAKFKNRLTLLYLFVVLWSVGEVRARMLPPDYYSAEYLVPYPVVRLWHRPKADVYLGSFSVRYSRQGLRDGFYPEKQPGVFRILCVGDSFTEGWGEESFDAYPKLLEKTLRQSHPRLRIEVVNFGTTGFAPWQEAVMLKKRGFDFEPDLILAQAYLGNDLMEEMLRTSEGIEAYIPQREKGYYSEYRWMPHPLPFWCSQQSALFRFIYESARRRLRAHPWLEEQWKAKEIAPSAARVYWAEPDLITSYPALEEAWNRLEWSMTEISEACRARQVPVLAFNVPDQFVIYRYDPRFFSYSKEQDYRATLYDHSKGNSRFLGICARHDIPAIDIQKDFKEHVRQPHEPLYISYDRHLSPAGNQLLAEMLAARIQEFLPADAAAGETAAAAGGGGR